MPTPTPTASTLSGCSEEVPLLGVTREFDFGQFIELFDATPDPAHPDRPSLSRIVIQPSATLAADRNAVSTVPQAISSTSSAMSIVGAPDSAPGPLSLARSYFPAAPQQPGFTATDNQGVAPEVDLFALTQHGVGAKQPLTSVSITDRLAFESQGLVQINGSVLKVLVTSEEKLALARGASVTAYVNLGEERGSLPVLLSYPRTHILLSNASLAQALSGSGIEGHQDVCPVLSADAIRALLNGRSVWTWSRDEEGFEHPIMLGHSSRILQPLSDAFELHDVGGFLADPAILSKDGGRIPLDLRTRDVQQLLTSGSVQLVAEGQSVKISIGQPERFKTDTNTDYIDLLNRYPQAGGAVALKPFGVTYPDIEKLLQQYGINKDIHVVVIGLPPGNTIITPVGGGVATNNLPPTTGGSQPATPPTMTDKVQPRLPSGTGLPVAVFVPWKQTWTLAGFSRGNLLSSIALAPAEQITMQVFSWERRTRTLDQSSETEVEQQTDFNQTTRDTEDVFKEMIAKRDFAWQLSGSIDASYSPGVASIRVQAGGSVSDTNSVQQTARSSSQALRENTVKASSRVRSKRVTLVTQTVETGREERVTRVIRNPNLCHTLTLDFFETLAHYDIQLQFMKSRMRLVVLVPNPIRIDDFTSEIVRRNEGALRNALIETSLVEGFDGCKMVAAYEEAKRLLAEQKSEATRIDETDSQRSMLPAPQAPSPASPQQAEVERIVKEMISALTTIRSGAKIDEALLQIAARKPLSESLRCSGQQWLFINFCAYKFPALLQTLDVIAGGSSTGLVAAQKVIAVLPRPDAPTSVATLNQMTDSDKEAAGIVGKLKETDPQGRRRFMLMDWDWGWWNERLKEEGLYSANDGGLGGACDQLQKAWQAWEAKKAQGDAMKDQDVAKTEAEGKQDKASSDDRLSMAFPLEELAKARERSKVLRDHFNEHKDFYNYALFQALPPTEQSTRILEASDGKLQVGLFEPRVVAMNGTRLVVPLTPLAGSPSLQAFVTSLGNDLETSFNAALSTPDQTVMPTPGVSISSRLGRCSACEDEIESARANETARQAALTRQEEAEANRRTARINASDLTAFANPPAALHVEVANQSSSVPTPSPT